MTEIEQIKQVALKNRIWYVGSVVIIGLILLCVFIFYKPKVKIDDTIIKQQQGEISRNEKEISALEGLVLVQMERINTYANRDSLLLQIAMDNKESIAKIKVSTNEKIKVFDFYGPDDWTKYYSQLPDPQR